MSERFDPSLRDMLVILWQRRGIASMAFVIVLIGLLTLFANWQGNYRSVAEIGFSQESSVGKSSSPESWLGDRHAVTAQEIETAIAEIKGQETLLATLSVLRGEGVKLGNASEDGSLFKQLGILNPGQDDIAPDDHAEADRLNDLRRGLEASRVGNAAVIEVSFRAKHPEIAQQALLAIVETYLWQREDRQKSAVRRQLAEAVSQFDAAQTELAALESDLAVLQNSAGILDADESARMLDRIYALDEQAEKLGQEVVGLRLARDSRNNAATLDDLLAIPDIAGHPVVRQVSAQLDAKKQEFVSLDQRYGPKHPIMQGKQREIEDLHSELGDAAGKVASQMDVELAGAEEKLRLITDQRDQWEERMAVRNKSVQGQAALSRSVALARANVQEIGQQVQSLRREMAAFHGDAAILHAPTLPAATEFPAKRDLALLAIMMALFAAVVAALLRHYFDQRIDDAFDPQTIVGIPLFARVPDQSVVRNATTAHEEATGHLAVLMRIMSQGRDGETQSNPNGQVIALGSAASGDGKSHIALALAEKLSGLGASVIVLDADLHDPAPPKRTDHDSKNDADLTDVMSGLVDPDDVISGPEHEEGYQYLGARMPVPGNIATGMIDGQLPRLIKRLRARFDHVIVDTPPILSVADGVIALGLADVRLFTLRCGHSKRRDITHALSQLRAAGIVPDGVVLNSAQARPAYGKVEPAMATKGQLT
ncbi:AAA family ATPase [Thalassospira sp.]|uniref:GumC family protein n=1 Tax=Thalassospira sp. TaxID=1912094 RepID=UPI001B0A82B2|nr:AAA family ATPase [Thalassospira sp.]MBO6808900.1 AAA family ATPase [Thalassospira sp.]MBO6840849.1 AAA family ATPase [Thalassospira sp.]